MKSVSFAWSAALLLVVAAAVLLTPAGQAQAQSIDCTRGTFPSYNSESTVSGPTVFELSQDYPDVLLPQEDYPWLDISFENGAPTDPRAYIEALLDFGLEGNVEVDWVVQDNPVRNWYHIPWMHYGPNGREFMRGLTHELDARPRQLGPDQTEPAQTWAISIIDDRGAYGIGQVWCDPNNPRPEMLNPEPTEPNWFADGSTQLKMLFTTATDEQVPWLRGTFEWDADAYVSDGSRNPVDPTDPNSSPPRTTRTLRLLQVDVAVRDSRATDTGWLFGTFIYDGRADGGDSPWDRLEPVGLMWGNDPGVTPEMVANGVELRQSWVNDDLRDLPGNHLGWAGRVAGPLDSPVSSCMSCHMVAGKPTRPILPEIQFSQPRPLPDAMRLNWFQNVPAGVVFAYDQTESLDYSLQLDMGIDRFHIANGNEDELRDETSSPARDLANLSPAEVAGIVEEPDANGDRLSTAALLIVGLSSLAAGIAGTAVLYDRRRVRRRNSE